MTSAIGAVVGGTIAFGIAVLGLMLPDGSFDIWGSVRVDRAAIVGMALFGIPVAIFLGGRLALGLVGANLRRVAERGLTIAVLAVALGAIEVVAVGLALEVPRSTAGPAVLLLLPYLIAAPIVGMVVFGPAVLVVTIPAGLAWAAIVRLLVGAERAPEVAP
jgi:hypothetical protein